MKTGSIARYLKPNDAEIRAPRRAACIISVTRVAALCAVYSPYIPYLAFGKGTSDATKEGANQYRVLPGGAAPCKRQATLAGPHLGR